MGLTAATTEQRDLQTPAAATLSLDFGYWQRRPAPGDPAPNLSMEDRAQAEKRFAVIEALVCPERFPQLWREAGGRKLAAVSILASQHGIKARTARSWLTKYTRFGLYGLIDRDRSDKGMPRKANSAAKDLILGLATPKRGVFGSLSMQEMFRAYEEERAWRETRIGKLLCPTDVEKYVRYIEEGSRLSERARLPQLSYASLRRYVQEIPEAVRTLAREGSETYRNTQEIISHRALSEIDPLEYVVSDHRVLDVFCRIPVKGGWRLGRPWITAALDMRTRKWLAWVLVETPSSDSIAAVLKKVFIGHGIPKNWYVDNGRDFRCEFLEGRQSRTRQSGAADLDTACRGVLGTLGVRVVHAIVKNARAKIIEPCFNRIANFDKQLPEYCGHRPSERPERFDEMVKQHEAWLRGERAVSPFRTIQEVATLYEDAIADINEMPLQGEGMQKATPTGRGWMSPAECFELLIQRVERRTVRLEDLHIIFSKRRCLKVQHGEICATFAGKKFYYRLEGEPTQLMAINGQLVEIAFDPHELSEVAVYWRDRYIGIGHCVELRRMGQDLFVQDERDRRAARRAVKQVIEAVHKQIPVASPEERLARRREVAPVRAPVPQVEVPAELPAPIAEACAARETMRQFSFSADQTSVPAVEQVRASDGDDSFCFFSDQGAETNG